MYKQYKELYIDTTTHTYTMDGVVVPSVTTLIYGKKDLAYTDAILAGKEIHSLIELTFKERSTEYIKVIAEKYPDKRSIVLRIGELATQYDAKFLEAEFILGGNLIINGKQNCFAGTVDGIFYNIDRLNNKVIFYIVDWKTGKLDYSTHYNYTLQLHGYFLLFKYALGTGELDKILSNMKLTREDVIIKGLLGYVDGLILVEESEQTNEDFKNLLQAYHNNLPGIVWNNGRLKRVALTTKSG